MRDEEEFESSPRILVADDDPSIRQLLTTIMRRERLESDAVCDGAEAVERLQERNYSVILLDLMMPRADGFAVIEYLKQHPQPFKPVVLVITAYADQRFKEVDADIVAGVIRKPFEVADLGDVVRRCVAGIDEELGEKLFAPQGRVLRLVPRTAIEN